MSDAETITEAPSTEAPPPESRTKPVHPAEVRDAASPDGAARSKKKQEPIFRFKSPEDAMNAMKSGMPVPALFIVDEVTIMEGQTITAVMNGGGEILRSMQGVDPAIQETVVEYMNYGFMSGVKKGVMEVRGSLAEVLGFKVSESGSVTFDINPQIQAGGPRRQ